MNTRRASGHAVARASAWNQANVFWAVVTAADLSEKGLGTAGDGGHALDAVLSSFAYAVGADTGQVMGTDDGYAGVLAAWALDGGERVEPWVSGSFLGRA